MVSLEFDPEVNALYFRLRKGKAAKSEPVSDNILIDLDNNERVVGLEVLLPNIKSKAIESLKTSIKIKA